LERLSDVARHLLSSFSEVDEDAGREGKEEKDRQGSALSPVTPEGCLPKVGSQRRVAELSIDVD
jgi:hypothetical protein